MSVRKRKRRRERRKHHSANTPSGRTLLVVAFFAGLGLITQPGIASAASTFGADLSQPADALCGQCAALTLTKSSGDAESGSPITGVLVSARIRTANGAGMGNFRVLRETGTPSEFLNVGQAAVSVTADLNPDGHITEVPTRIPIVAGDRLAISFPGQLTVRYLKSSPSALCVQRFEGPEQAIGTAATYESSDCGPFEVLVAGTVEADTDHDGFGDETQDQCPTDASTQGACPVAPVTPVATVNKKCKKHKKHRSAESAKKKCKKKKKKKKKKQ